MYENNDVLGLCHYCQKTKINYTDTVKIRNISMAKYLSDSVTNSPPQLYHFFLSFGNIYLGALRGNIPAI